MRPRLLAYLAIVMLLATACAQAAPVAGTRLPTVAPIATATRLAVSAAEPSPPPATAPPAATGTPAASPTPYTPPDLRYLQNELDATLAGFDGLSSYVVIDLGSGATISHNPDLPVAGASLLKIPIVLEAYRVLDQSPDPALTRVLTETAALSGNFTANLLLEKIAGKEDPFAGALLVTQRLRQMGIFNTFIAVPYDLEPAPGYQPTYLTPANQSQQPSTNPDPFRQTTTGDMAQILALIDACSRDQGALLQLAASELTAFECQAVLDLFVLNRIDAFTELGVPEDVYLAHKHGWIDDTHGDAALVRSPNGTYVFTVALYRPGWLEWDISNPLIGELSRLVYTHFNDPAAYSPAQLAIPLPPATAPPPTPDLPMIRVGDTRGAGLTLREAPNGSEIGVLPDWYPLYLLPDAPVDDGGLTWRHVRTYDGQAGWVGDAYLEVEQAAPLP